MLITLTRGQFFESLFPEAPASAEALTSVLRRRHSVGVYTPEITIEGDLCHIQIDEVEVDRTRSEYPPVMRLVERRENNETMKRMRREIRRETATSIVNVSTAWLISTEKITTKYSIGTLKYAVRPITMSQPKAMSAFELRNKGNSVLYRHTIVTVCILPQDNA